MTDVSARPQTARPPAAPGRPPLVTIEPTGASRRLRARPFPVGHALADHPLLTLEGIAELADALPPSSIERHRADQPLLVPGGAEELDGRPSDTVRNIETNNTWMVLWYVEQDPAWKRLLHDCLDEVEAHVRGRDGGMLQREGFLFLSAPNAVTPWHFDPEHNLLLQIRGTKEMNVGRFDGPAPTSCASSTATTTAGTATSEAPGNVQPFRARAGQAASTSRPSPRTGCATATRSRSRCRSRSAPAAARPPSGPTPSTQGCAGWGCTRAPRATTSARTGRRPPSSTAWTACAAHGTASRSGARREPVRRRGGERRRPGGGAPGRARAAATGAGRRRS